MTREDLVEARNNKKERYEINLKKYGRNHLNTKFYRILLGMAESKINHYDWFGR